MSLSSGTVWVLLYLGQLLLVSLALGIVAMHQPRALLTPRLPRFLVGFCSAPFVLAVWMLLLAAILPGAPRWLFLAPLPAAAVVVLGLHGPRALRRLTNSYLRACRPIQNRWPVYAIYVTAALLLAMVGSKLVINSRPPIIAHDALMYLGEALPFAEERSLAATTWYHDWPDGSIRGDVHGFMFPAFLSHALINTGDNQVGYPYDQATRVAFQVTFIYMLLAVAALAGTCRQVGTGGLALILLLQVPQLEYISSNSSRDAFRIIPLVLLVTALSGLAAPRLRLRLPRAALLPPLVLAAFSLGGHTLGLFVVGIIALAWLAWNVPQRVRWRNLLLVLGATGLGVLVGGFHYLQSYLETGRFGGYAPLTYALQGTPLLETWLRQERFQIAIEATNLQRLLIILERDHFRLSVPGLLAALIALLCWARFKGDSKARAIPFVNLVVLGIASSFAGALDTPLYPLSIGFIANFRYPLHWYPFAAVCLAILAVYGYNELTSRGNRQVRRLAPVIIVLLVSLASYSAYQTIDTGWRTTDTLFTGSDERFLERVALLETVTQAMPANERLLMDDERLNYYLRNRAIVAYSQPTWRVIQAGNEDEAKSALKALNVGAVALLEANIPGWWDQIALFGVLRNPEFAVVSSRDQYFRVYIVDEMLVRQQKQLDESIVRTLEAPLLALDFAKTVKEGDESYAIAGTEQRVKIEGALRVVEGPRPDMRALVVAANTRVNGPPSALNLKHGSLVVWARLADPPKAYSALVRANIGNDLYLYHPEPNGGIIAFYNGVNLGSTPAIIDRDWHHYAFTWQDDEQKLYVDGSLMLSAKVPANTTSTKIFAIGWLGDRDGEQWGGILANVITFNRPISSDEAAALYRTGLSR